MTCCANCSFLSSPSGIFRLLTVVTGIPAIALAWLAYFSSSWTDVFPEILAILQVEKSALIDLSPSSSLDKIILSDDSSSSSSSSEEEIDIISDKEEEYLDEILLQTLMYEKFFIGIVSVVFLLSAAYLMLRILSKHRPDSPYEIMFDFIFHVLCALGLLTGSGLVLLSAAKIQNFVDQITDRDGFAPEEVVTIIEEHRDNVQDKTDKIAAAVIAMFNGILYALCVVTIKMTSPLKCKCCRDKKKARYPYGYYDYDHHHHHKKTLPPSHPQQQFYNDMPVFSVMPTATAATAELQHQHDPAYASYGFYRNGNGSNSYRYE